MRRGINAVAAMQFSISDAGATKFARGLYSALASGRSIGDAIGSGRIGLLSTPGSLEWVTPVLYVRGDTSTLFTITPASPPRPALPSVQSADGQRLADGQTRTGPSRKVLAIVGGIVAAAVACVVTILTLFSSSSSEPPTTTATTGAVTTKSGPPPVTESTESSAVPPPTTSSDPGSTSGDPDPFVRTLAAAGVDSELARWKRRTH